jgi:hypothetical protein
MLGSKNKQKENNEKDVMKRHERIFSQQYINIPFHNNHFENDEDNS